MDQVEPQISAILGTLNELAPAGYAIGLHITYTTPKFMFQSYDDAWLTYYSQNGLLMSDPTVTWGFTNAGSTRWSALEDSDPAAVMAKAAEFGINFGISCAVEDETDVGIRSIASFARSDREMTDDEISQIYDAFVQLHNKTANHARLSDETVRQLKKMSIMVTNPSA